MASKSLDEVRALVNQIGVCGVVDCLADLARQMADESSGEAKTDWEKAADLLGECWEELPTL